MLNYETLLSSYDDKLTLMQWLKKVEEALKDASAVSFNVNKRGDATLTFSVIFEDGSELETGPIVLQQGESVQAATIRNGHLILTLTNGDELDAGDTGAVTGFFINGSQHLIVQYQNGTTQDLGAILAGNISISGNLSVSGGFSVGNAAFGYDSVKEELIITKPLVEDMTGYTFSPASLNAGWQRETIYVSACRNGDKLTCVLAFNFERTDNDAENSMNLGTINVPLSVLNILYPVNIGGSNLLARISVVAVDSYSGTGAVVPVWVSKGADHLQFGCDLSSLNTNVKYYLRVEVTFLLSDNLAA